MSYTLLQINVVANSGSTGKIAEDIGKLVIANDWQSYIAYGRIGRNSTSNLIYIGDKHGFNVKEHGIESRIFDNHGLASRSATKRFIKQIEEINPNIIHLHNIHGYYINYKILFEYLQSKQIPVVWTLHDCWSFTGHCAHFDFIGCKKWKTQCYDCIEKKTYLASFLLDRSKKNYLQKKELFTSLDNVTIVAVSNWLDDLIKESFLSKYPTKVIHNGIDLQLFRNYENNHAKEKIIFGKKCNNLSEKFSDLTTQKIILGVSNVWHNRKGFDDYIKLSKIVDKDTIIVLVGVNDKQIKVLPNNIIGIKRTENQKELAELYSVADMFFNPTYEDNFPTTNIEALACGTPVVTYKTGGSIEAVDENTGFVIEQGAYNEVPQILEKIKTKGKQYYKQICRQRAEQYYNKDFAFQQYLDLYEKILK